MGLIELYTLPQTAASCNSGSDEIVATLLLRAEVSSSSSSAVTKVDVILTKASNTHLTLSA
jgi:hypothetical protein